MRIFITFVAALAGLAQVLAAQRTDKIFLQGIPAGTQTVQTESTGTTRAEYSYNDRGRGDHIVATWKVDVDGLPIEYEGRGNDYMKAPIDERFEIKTERASWKNRSEKGDRAASGKAFYLPMDAPPEFVAVLARALLKAPGHKLALLPAGEASIEPGGKANIGKGELTEYRITGLGFTPQSIWLGHDGGMATLSGWFSIISTPYEGAITQLRAAQEKTDAAWSQRLAHEMTRIPKGDLVIRNARLFDPRDLSVTPGRSVLVRGDRIIRIEADADLKASDNAEIIDARSLPDAGVVGQSPAFWQSRRWRARSCQWRDQRARHGQ
jgi:hypothetical protein